MTESVKSKRPIVLQAPTKKVTSKARVATCKFRHFLEARRTVRRKARGSYSGFACVRTHPAVHSTYRMIHTVNFEEQH